MSNACCQIRLIIVNFCYCLDSQHGNKHISWLLWPNRISSLANIHGFQYNLVPWCLRKDFRKLSYIDQDNCLKHGIRYSHWRILCLPSTLEEQFSSIQSKKYPKSDEYGSDSSLKDVPAQPIDNDQVYQHSTISAHNLLISVGLPFSLQYGAFS